MKKIGGVIVSHGQVATELLAAAETVVGDISHVTAVSIGWHDDVEMAQDQVERAIKSVSQGSGVLVINQRVYRFEPGDVVVVWPGQLHMGWTLQGTSRWKFWIAVSIWCLVSAVDMAADLSRRRA